MRPRLIMSLALGFTIAGCAAAVQQKEDLLSAAGFQYRPADTPQRIAALQQLPAHKFVRQVGKDRVFWVYADPTVCKCLYAGDERAYSNYRQAVFQQRLADENLMAAQIAQDAAVDQLLLGPWAPWGPYYY